MDELEGIFTRKKFDYIKEKYGNVGSWAIWADVGDKPKSNMGDLTILDPDINKNLLAQLKPNIIFVGLNISGRIEKPFANFHSPHPRGQDYKTRFALRGTAYWGGYMTDIIKDFEQKISGKVISYLKNNKQFEEENVKMFLQELADIGANNPTLIAFGNDSYNILKRNFNHKFKILKVPHYAIYISKEKYREQIKLVIY